MAVVLPESPVENLNDVIVIMGFFCNWRSVVFLLNLQTDGLMGSLLASV